MGFIVVERRDDNGEVLSRWTTERPGVTGPRELRSLRLLWKLWRHGWSVRWRRREASP